MATVSCMVVLVIGNCLGAIVKGITGFGSAILNLCVWVVCVCLGIDGGTLQQAVVSECVCSEFCALPLLGLTKAGRTCDWRLVCALLLSGAVGAPVGAFLLTSLPARLVEFVMACALLLVICLQCKLVQHIKGWLHRSRADIASSCSKECSFVRPLNSAAVHSDNSMCCQASGAESLLSQPSCLAHQDISSPPAPQQTALQQQQHSQLVHFNKPCAPAALRTVAQELVPLPLQPRTSSDCMQVVAAAAEAEVAILINTNASTHSTGAAASTGHADCSPHASAGGQLQSPGSSSTASITCAASVQACGRAQPHELECLAAQTLSHDRSSNAQEAAPLLQAQQAAGYSGCSTAVNSSSSDSVSKSTLCSRSCLQRLRAGWEHAMQPEQRQAAMHMFFAGALAGSVGGVMQGMTGMGGPPLMYMYEKLQVGKDTVRGCNAVLNVLQVRVIAYALAGVFTLEDIWLYIAVSVTGLLGLCLGDRLAGRMNQQIFSKVMVSLMFLCCALLFASSAGMMDRQEQQ